MPCAACGRRLATSAAWGAAAGAFCVFPDGVTTHVACAARYNFEG